MSAVTENQKTVPPPTKIELQELEQDYIVKCTKVSLGHRPFSSIASL